VSVESYAAPYVPPGDGIVRASVPLVARGRGGRGARDRGRPTRQASRRLAPRPPPPDGLCHGIRALLSWLGTPRRLFSYISANWRGRPLTSLAVIINLIASTRTRTGLRVRAELDTGKYPLGVEVPEEDLATIRLRKHRVHGEWNYTIRPRR